MRKINVYAQWSSWMIFRAAPREKRSSVFCVNRIGPDGTQEFRRNDSACRRSLLNRCKSIALRDELANTQHLNSYDFRDGGHCASVARERYS
jgi:hypothetical protein